MDTREYIESGILEAYILGALTQDEQILVEANIAQFPELADELLAIETAMQQFAATLATDPPTGLQDKIWNSIQTNAVDKESVAPKAKLIPLQPQAEAEKGKKLEWRYAAAVAALIGSAFLNILLWQQGKQSKADAVALTSKVDTMQQQQQQLVAQLSNFNKEKSMMADTAMQTVVMHTTQPGHPMAATVYWSKKEGVAYVSVDALPAPPAGMQYQLWVMQDGKPVDMGVIPNDIASTPQMQKMAKSVTTGQAFAISLEKAGGSPSPTMANIYVMGAAS